MKHRFFSLLFILYLLLFTQVVFSQQETVPASPTAETAAGEAAARQFRINCDALLQGSSEEIRVDAAVSLLLQNDARSREFLVSTLALAGNADAVNAVCKALVKSRATGETLGVFLDPLLTLLRDGTAQQARPAAEATLLYGYADISGSLRAILHDPEASLQSRLNVIYALQLRSDTAALEDLILLLDDPDPEVVRAAEAALQESFGIPVGTSRKDWSDILADLKLKSPEEIAKDRLKQQTMKLREVEADRDRWQRLYLSSLDKQYELLDEAGRVQLISDQMDSDMAALRLWAIDKTAKYAIVPELLRQQILTLLSDDSKDVRLQTAKALMNMSAINPAAVLLERYHLETDPEVALAMFEALGEACFFAFSPGSNIELPKEIKEQTLEIASGNYLMLDSADAARKAAEVIRKILELNNLSKESIRSHLELLKQRYQISIGQNAALRADLLAVLAHLCDNGGAKEIAGDLYEPLFRKALDGTDSPSLRLAAARGLSYVDKVGALELFKQNNLMDDESMAIQRVVIDLAGQTGDASDLEWLMPKLAVNGHTDQVWTAVRSICERQNARFLLNWLPILEAATGSKDEYVREILSIAEQKAIGEKDLYLLDRLREKTIGWFAEHQAFEQGGAYIAGLGDQLFGNDYSDQTNQQILQLALYGGLADVVSQVIELKLVSSDIPQQSAWLTMLDEYFFSEKVDDAAKLRVFEKLSSISIEARPSWTAFLQDIKAQLNSIVAQKKPVDTGKDSEQDKTGQ